MGMGSGCGRPVLKRALGAAQIHGRSQDKLLRVGWGFGWGWVPSGQGLAACCQLPSSSTQFKHLLTLWILKNSPGQGYLPEKCWEVGIPLECFPKTCYFSEKVTNGHAGGDGKQTVWKRYRGGKNVSLHQNQPLGQFLLYRWRVTPVLEGQHLLKSPPPAGLARLLGHFLLFLCLFILWPMFSLTCRFFFPSSCGKR